MDGMLTRIESFDAQAAERVLGRIKYLAKLQTWQNSTPQDGRIPKDDAGTSTDIRVATYPTVTGEKVVLRLFSNDDVPSLDDLQLDAEALSELRRFLSQPSGLLLLTGPAGSGKSTTIYACLKELSSVEGRHIITIEDPVERVLPGVMQTEVNEAQGLTYAKAARHLMRQDPQILVLGEIRDDESAQIAVRTAMTGHLVISTLHAGSCQGVFERLWTMVPDPFTITSAVSLVMNQRLLRRLCPSCQGEKCKECLRTGYSGRLPIIEWFRMSEEQGRSLRNGGVSDLESGSDELRRQCRKLMESAQTDSDEVARVIGG